jgi:hypothetical protein
MNPDSVRWIVLEAVVPIVGWTLLSLILLSILFAVTAWIWFVLQMRRKKNTARLRLGESQSSVAGRVPVSLQLTGILRPLLGMVNARIVLRNLYLSEIIMLDENIRERGRWFRYAIGGQSYIDLHDRGLHDVEEIQILFVDALRLIVLPYTIEANRQLYTLPPQLQPNSISAEPNRTEQQTQRIQIPKRVEGEYINYKDFEAGDDVRRIVWKIYARNGELVVRIPEATDPYASHLVFYASFYNGLSNGNDKLNIELLNAYKDKVRNLLEAAQSNGYEVRLPADQPAKKAAMESQQDQLLFRIATADWQNILPPAQYVNPKDAALICVSSLTPLNAIEELIQKVPPHIPIVCVQLSNVIPTFFQLSIQEFFFQKHYQPADKLRGKWSVAPLRTELLKNEHAIDQFLAHRGNAQLIGGRRV